MKKVLSLIVLASMILTMIPFVASAEGESTLYAPPEGAEVIVLDDLADMVDMAKVGGNYVLNEDLVITMDMIDALYSPMTTPAEGEEPAPLPCAHMNVDGTPAECPFGLVQKATYKYEMNEDGSHKVDGEGNPIYTRSYDYSTAISLTLLAVELVLDENGEPVPINIYGNNHSITFEKGIVFTGTGVLFGKIYTDANLYDLKLGTEDNMIQMDCSYTSANIGVIVGQPNAFQQKVESGLVGNLVCDNVHICANITEGRSNDNHIGGFVGDGKAAVTIKNSTFRGSITKNLEIRDDKTGEVKEDGYVLPNKTQFGGFVGTWRCKQKDLDGIDFLPLVLENCTNYATLNTNAHGYNTDNTAVGGMLGGLLNGKAYIKNCTNYGTMLSSRNAGGIVGFSSGDTLTVENCTNEGIIKQTHETLVSGAGAAGIVAKASSHLIIKNCVNKQPDISAVSDKAITAGIVSIYDATRNVTIENNESMIAADLVMTPGAAVKFATPTNLMFQASLSSSIAYDAMVAKYGAENVKYGMYIAKLSDLPAEGGIEALLASDPSKVTDAPITWNEDKTAYTAISADIAATDYLAKYVAVGYMIVTENGSDIKLVSVYNSDNARCVDDVAYAAYNDREPMEWDMSTPPYIVEVEEESFSCYTMAGLETLKTMFDEANHPVETPAE